MDRSGITKPSDDKPRSS